MGKYINSINGIPAPDRGKARFILENDSTAKAIDPPTEFVDGLVCVVDNGPFEAAGYAYSENEMRAFLRGTGGRPKQWLLVPKAAEYAK